MTTPQIGSVARCLFPGGKAVLAAYDKSGAFLLGVGIKTRDVVGWARKGVSKADRLRMTREVRETFASS